MNVGDMIYRMCPALCPVLRDVYHWLKWGWACCSAIPQASRNYKKVLSRLRTEVHHRKIRVLFLLDENAKWKCQRVYELMDRSSLFEPIVALTRGDIDWELSQEEFVRKFRGNRFFCERHNLRYVEVYACDSDQAIDLSTFAPDIVFYQHPWQLSQCQEVASVSQFALTCYVPYYVIFYDATEMDAQRSLHQLVFRYFLINDEWVRHFNYKRHGFPIAGQMVGTGHPMLDLYDGQRTKKGDVVIYAPHWSVPNTIKPSECYSTFLETGELMLKYAKEHSDVKWCFKPHPSLRRTLECCPGWTKDRINRYYGEWESLGEACYTGDYPEIFKRSRAMITDCTSFLIEYSTLDKPLVYLISKKSRFAPGKPNLRLIDTFYQVREPEELVPMLDKIILCHEDPNMEARQKAARDMNILDSHASENILRHLADLILGE